MLDPLRHFIRQRRSLKRVADAPAESPHDEIQLAATALLLEFACADEPVTPHERALTEAALGRHFNLDERSVQELLRLAAAERRASPDAEQFTFFARAHLDVGQRVLLGEVIYRMMLADACVADADQTLMHRLATLLDVAPAYLAVVQQRLAPPEKRRA